IHDWRGVVGIVAHPNACTGEYAGGVLRGPACTPVIALPRALPTGHQHRALSHQDHHIRAVGPIERAEQVLVGSLNARGLEAIRSGGAYVPRALATHRLEIHRLDVRIPPGGEDLCDGRRSGLVLYPDVAGCV